MAADPPTPRSRRILHFLGLRPSTIGVLGMGVLVGMGGRMPERFLPVCLMALRGGAVSNGLLNGLDNLLSALYSFPGGYLCERIGTQCALLVFNLIAMAGFLIVIVFPAWQAVIAGFVLFITFVPFTCFPLLLLFCRSIEWRIPAFVVQGAGVAEHLADSGLPDLPGANAEARGFFPLETKVSHVAGVERSGLACGKQDHDVERGSRSNRCPALSHVGRAGWTAIRIRRALRSGRL